MTTCGVGSPSVALALTPFEVLKWLLQDNTVVPRVRISELPCHRDVYDQAALTIVLLRYAVVRHSLSGTRSSSEVFTSVPHLHLASTTATPNGERQTTVDAKRRTTNDKRQTTNNDQRTLTTNELRRNVDDDDCAENKPTHKWYCLNVSVKEITHHNAL